jgi:magnesium transporter
MEKEGRDSERRVKRITEPQLVNGRLRPIHRDWYRSEEEAPYRFTYFNEVVQSTIHALTISELVQPGGSFEELFRPEPMLLSDDSESDSDNDGPLPQTSNLHHVVSGNNGESNPPTRQPSVQENLEASKREAAMSPVQAAASSHIASDPGTTTPTGLKSPSGQLPQSASAGRTKEKAPRYGERPVWWLDVMCPTEAEMKMLAKVFGIHALTAEDIMQQEDREKVELFRHYYFVNYRTFDQDVNSEDYLEPINFYIVVFREGVLSFHFSMTPHCANVRRRIRQLKDYMSFSADWISYGVIDDITDVFGPLIRAIADETEDIDDAVLRLFSAEGPHRRHQDRIEEERPSAEDIMRRIGDCRKRVTSLYRLLSSKADVIKSFAKRCNEQWDVAPRSDIGMFLGDIQDHIVTMTANLAHFEK